MTTLIEAGRKYIGQREVPGPGFSAWIKDLWIGLPGGQWFWDTYGRDDSALPWCGAFMARCCKDVGLSFPKQYSSARSWEEWGDDCNGPRLGSVAVLRRDGGGHVGIVTGVSSDERLVRILGGNQNDGVGEAWFLLSRVTAWRKPAGSTLPKAAVAHVTELSRSEV